MKKAICVLLFLMVLCLTAMAVSEEFLSVSAGDIITFGSYEQDNNPDNGPEPIEWIVLDVQDGKALLLSRYGLEAKQYNTEYTDVTWETCTLRAWLNNDFLSKVFSAEEQLAILTTEVDNSEAQGFDWTTVSEFVKTTTVGNNTQDKIFLLSYAEANRYLGVTLEDYNNIQSRVAPTDYAINNGAFASSKNNTADSKMAGWWWLRTSGFDLRSAMFVNLDGSPSLLSVNNGRTVVRPSLWVDLNSGIF